MVSEVGDSNVTMYMHTGIPQGCPNGPPLYVTGYEGVTDQVDEQRTNKGDSRITVHCQLTMAETDPPKNADRTTYVDDHLESTLLDVSQSFEELYSSIVSFVESIVLTQKNWNITNNLNKTVILLELHGKGSRKLYKKFGKEFTLSDGSKIRIVVKTKYLGTLIGGHNDSINEDITERIKK